MSTRLKRVKAEVFDLLAPEFGTEKGRVTFDAEEGLWVCVRQLDIPQTVTPDGDGKVDILLLVPSTYPQIPPDGFYCDQMLRLSGHYFVPMGFSSTTGSISQQLREAGWNWYCAHSEKRQEMAARWKPHADHRKGDNLNKYLLLCLSILGTEGRRRGL
ncbi:MAG: hypothetical protein IPK19_38435 [Chloroflexi bacterium]|nr:hypothetical protein [Chloroflexota bacterium]